MEKLQSRKLWVTILGGALIGILEATGTDVEPETIYGILGLVGLYVGGQGAVDVAAKLHGS